MNASYSKSFSKTNKNRWGRESVNMSIKPTSMPAVQTALLPPNGDPVEALHFPLIHAPFNHPARLILRINQWRAKIENKSGPFFPANPKPSPAAAQWQPTMRVSAGPPGSKKSATPNRRAASDRGAGNNQCLQPQPAGPAWSLLPLQSHLDGVGCCSELRPSDPALAAGWERFQQSQVITISFTVETGFYFKLHSKVELVRHSNF